MSGFQLGHRVRFSTHIRRRHSMPGEFDGPNRLWSTHPGPGLEHQPWKGGEGIIVGRRTLSNGNADWFYDEAATYTSKDSFTAYVVAFDLHRKPVHVLPEHLEVIQ